MANPRATGKKSKRGPELAQRIRSLLLKAMDIVDKDGKLLSEIVAEELKKNPIKFLELASKYVPKEIEADIEMVRGVINAQPEMSPNEWQKKHATLSGDPSQDRKPH